MRKFLLATTGLFAVGAAHAQSVQSGTIGGMPYYLLPASGGCSAAAPCSVVTYLSVQSESQGATLNDLSNYFGGAFAQANPHTIVIAPVENGPQDATTNWGGYNTPTTPEGQQMVAVVQGVEAQMGNTVNPADSVVTGGSLGGTGTQAALVAYGPKGTVQPGVFSAGLSFDAADWSAAGNATQIAALCGVPLEAVHGMDDTNQNISFDQNLVSAIDSNPACGNSATLTPIQGAGHGTWSGPDGYAAGTGAGTPLGWATAQLGSDPAPAAAGALPTTSATPAAQAATPTATSSTQAAASVSDSADSGITPGQGSLTDCSGNTWTVNTNNKILENGQPVLGGGDTSSLMIQNCTVYGLSNGQNGSQAGWFTLSSVTPGSAQNWTMGAAPTGASAATATAATSTDTATTQAGTAPAAATVAAPTVCGSGVPSGAFHVANGQIIGPDGKPFIARGINMADNDMGSASAAIALFPGLNFVRLAVYTYQDPSAYASFISTMTSRGTVVEIEHHVETNGATGGGGQGDIASGSWLAQENAFYGAMAQANASNPYVWFGTTNEPPTAPGLSEWQQATYNAIRGAGNNNIVMLELAGWPGGWQADMDPSVYASMTNVVWDTHFYGWVAKYSTDQNAVNQALADEISGAQTITSADGTVPALIGEYGPSTTGESMDANGTQAVTAVLNAGGSGAAGSGAWHWGMQDCCNNLNSGSTLTSPNGQMVALYINTSVIPCSTEETATNAQAATTAITSAMAQDPTTPAITAPTTANAIQAAQSSSLAQQAQAVAAGQ